MLDLKAWLDDHGLTVKAFAIDFDAPLKTVEDWVYRGKSPSKPYQERITDYVLTHCTHYWLIDVPDGPMSQGVCRRCGQGKMFENSGWNFSLTGKATSKAPKSSDAQTMASTASSVDKTALAIYPKLTSAAW